MKKVVGPYVPTTFFFVLNGQSRTPVPTIYKLNAALTIVLDIKSNKKY